MLIQLHRGKKNTGLEASIGVDVEEEKEEEEKEEEEVAEAILIREVDVNKIRHRLRVKASGTKVM